MMNIRVKPWEIALGLGLLLAVLSGAFLERTGLALSDNLLRLHVVANSDAASDQALKLTVRDEVLRTVTPMLSDAATSADARDILTPYLGEIEDQARRILRTQGYHYPVRVSMAKTSFPTKTYDGFKLPAGVYDALRIEIGEARGQNWWCVVFPPLCMAAAEEVTFTALEDGMTDDQVRLITGDGQTYVFAFKCLEWWDDVKGFFGR